MYGRCLIEQRGEKPLRLQRYNKKMTYANLYVIFLIFSLIVYNKFRNSSANGGRFLLSPYIIFSLFLLGSISAWSYWVCRDIT